MTAQQVNPDNDLDLFAKVENGEVVEFPVYRLHIKNRAHPIHWYTPVIDAPKPDLQPFHKHISSLTVGNHAVLQSYIQVPLTLPEIFAQLRPNRDPMLSPNQPQPEPPSIADVDPALIEHVYSLVSDYATDKLNTFSKTRGYTSLDTLLGRYKNSSVPKLQAEALRGQHLLDQTWVSLLTFFDEVTSGTRPIPTSLEEIDALLPALTWED